MDIVALCGYNKPTYLTQEFFKKLPCKHIVLDLKNNYRKISREKNMDITHVSLFIFHHQTSTPHLLSKIEFLKKTHPSIPIIMTVDKPDDKITRWALRFRMWDCIVLPLEMNYLRKQIKVVQAFMRLKKNSHRLAILPSDSNSHTAMDFIDSPVTKIEPALQYISTNYDKKIKVTRLANLCNMSISTFSTQFKHQMGVNLRTHLKGYRINIAKKLLLETNLKIKEIANYSGFEEVSQFNRQFKSIALKTPSEFRLKFD